MNAPRVGIPLRPDRSAVDREWRRSFIRAATSVVIAKLQKTNAVEIQRANWPNDRSAELLVRGAVSPITQDAYPGSTVAKLLLLAPNSGAAMLFPLATVVDLKGVASFSFPLPTNFADASFVGDGQPIPVRQGTFAGMPIGPVHKLALLAALSGELESASGNIAETIISHTLEVAVGRGLDAVLFSASAATADAPAGLLFGATMRPGSADMANDLGALIGAIASKGIDTSSTVFVCASPQALAISLLAGPFFSHRIIEASNLAANTVVAVAVSGLVIAGDGAIPQVDVGKQAVLNFADPASPLVSPAGTVAAPTISTFQTDLLALRCTARVTRIRRAEKSSDRCRVIDIRTRSAGRAGAGRAAARGGLTETAKGDEYCPQTRWANGARRRSANAHSRTMQSLCCRIQKAGR
jgi:hypothetical protein